MHGDRDDRSKRVRVAKLHKPLELEPCDHDQSGVCTNSPRSRLYAVACIMQGRGARDLDILQSTGCILLATYTHIYIVIQHCTMYICTYSYSQMESERKQTRESCNTQRDRVARKHKKEKPVHCRESIVDRYYKTNIYIYYNISLGHQSRESAGKN